MTKLQKSNCMRFTMKQNHSDCDSNILMNVSFCQVLFDPYFNPCVILLKSKLKKTQTRVELDENWTKLDQTWTKIGL